MRLFLCFSFLLFSSLAFGQKKLKGKPATLEQTYRYLDQIFDDTAKYSFMKLPEDVATGRLHFGLGMWMRNNWRLWGRGKLKRYFLERGVLHPEDMSGIILTSYHRYLNNQAIGFDKQAESYRTFYQGIVQHGDTIFYPQELLKAKTTDSALVQYFPVNDTICVSVYASYKRWFSTYASSVRATAVVREHRKNKLFVELILMEKDFKKNPNRKVGDFYEETPRDCDLIPPKGWTSRKP